MLSVNPSDGCIEGEPYWAAKFIDNLEPYHTGDWVKLAYLPAYHDDCGALGHNADSEFIQLTVAYNPATQHWLLLNSWLSAHSCNTTDITCILNGAAAPFSSHTEWGPDFEYPSGRTQSFPRVYVSKSKHANYRNWDACNSGGAFWSDTCVGNSDVGRLLVWQDRNLGSARYPMRDCVASISGHPLRQGTECFWTGDKFRGWHFYETQGASPYGGLLTSAVFQGFMITVGNWWIGSYGL